VSCNDFLPLPGATACDSGDSDDLDDGDSCVRSFVVTLVSGGAVKRKTDAGGLVNVTVVNPVSKAGSVWLLPNTWTRSGTCVRESTASRTEDTSERASRGLSTSS
jgi:hypothetical protein